EEVIALRNQDRTKKMQSLKEPKQLSPLAGAPSIYKLPFPIPGAPGVEPITPVPTAILSAPPPPPSLGKPTREDPKVITVSSEEIPPKPTMPPPRAIVFGGTAADKTDDADDEDEMDDDVRYEDVEESP
ncbi:MAG: hypothetical protein KJ043_22780, partial [Anaerolineae bacterium]|nr:hypothetical protein [Anaerolineae bacterium]